MERSNRVYLDYNATAPVRPEVVAAMAEAMGSVGNASSMHADGRGARSRIEKARSQLAALVGAPPENVVFTSGGTEANNQAIKSAGGAVLASAIEHESVLQASGDGSRIGVDDQGRIDLDALRSAIDEQAPAMIAVMLANNETGVIQPVREVARIAAGRGILLHVDAVQAAGKLPIDMAALGADFLSLSAHKLGGPQGVGALIARPGVEPDVLLQGGAQERRLRAGTENVAGLSGFGLAVDLARDDHGWKERVAALRDRLESDVMTIAPDARIFGRDAPRLANTSCLTMPGVSHETQLMAFDLAGIAVSSGSACSSGKVGPSHVLAAMGIAPAEAGTAIRVSLGWNSTAGDVDRFVSVYRDLLARRRLRESA